MEFIYVFITSIQISRRYISLIFYDTYIKMLKIFHDTVYFQHTFIIWFYQFENKFSSVCPSWHFLSCNSVCAPCFNWPSFISQCNTYWVLHRKRLMFVFFVRFHLAIVLSVIFWLSLWYFQTFLLKGFVFWRVLSLWFVLFLFLFLYVHFYICTLSN